MKTFEEYKDYYRNASKDEILEDTYQDYVSLDIANKKLEEIKEKINHFLDNWEAGGALTEYHIIGEPPSKDLQDILSIIGNQG